MIKVSVKYKDKESLVYEGLDLLEAERMIRLNIKMVTLFCLDIKRVVLEDDGIC